MSDTVEIVPWQPDLLELSTEKIAQLTAYLSTLAESHLKHIALQDPDFPTEGQPEWEAKVAQLTYRLVLNWTRAGEASELQIMDWIERESLYLWLGWSTLEQMLEDIAQDASPSGRSVWTRVAKTVLPFVREHEIADVTDMMRLISKGGKGRSKLYHALPIISEAISEGDTETVKSVLDDVLDETQTRRDVLDKWRGSRDIIPPAPAELRQDGQGTWTLTVTMSDEQKRLIVSRLRDRIRMEEEL